MTSDPDEGVKSAASDGLRVEVGRVASCPSTGTVASFGDDGIERSGLMAVDMVQTEIDGGLIYYSWAERSFRCNRLVAHRVGLLIAQRRAKCAHLPSNGDAGYTP